MNGLIEGHYPEQSYYRQVQVDLSTRRTSLGVIAIQNYSDDSAIRFEVFPNPTS
jgi:hypothetical protein